MDKLGKVPMPQVNIDTETEGDGSSDSMIFHFSPTACVTVSRIIGKTMTGSLPKTLCGIHIFSDKNIASII